MAGLEMRVEEWCRPRSQFSVAADEDRATQAGGNASYVAAKMDIGPALPYSQNQAHFLVRSAHVAAPTPERG